MRPKLVHLALVPLLALVFLVSASAGGVSAVDSCDTSAAPAPVVITESCKLSEDVEFDEDGFVIEADDVTLDLNGHTITGNGGVSHSGVEVNGFDRATIKNGTIREFQHGVELGDSSNSLVTGNNIKDNGMLVLDINDPDDPTDDEMVPNGTGIDLIEAQGNVIERNTIKDNVGRGIDVESASSANLVRSNTITGSADRGIDVREASTANVIEGNTFSQNVGMAVDVRGAGTLGNVVRDNTIRDNEGRGINVRQGASTNVIEGNTVKDNGGAGIVVSASDFNEVVDNVVTGNGTDGLALSDANGNSVHGNRFNTNARDGLNLDEFSMNNVVRDNEMNDNAEQGVRVRTANGDPTNNLFLSNELLDNNDFDILDETDGAATEGTANWYISNECETSDPGGLCE